MTDLIKNILKILILAFIIFMAYRIIIFFINANNNSTLEKANNSINYKNILSSEISKSGVAITTNIGMNFNQKKNISPTIYNDLFSIEELKKDKKNVENNIISKHMIAIKEYNSFIKTDFKNLLKNSDNKKKTLEGIYSQLSLRYNVSLDSIKNLKKQKEVLLKEFESLESQIDFTKKSISENYKKTDTNAVNENISTLLKLRQDQNYVRTYIIFINNFLRSYLALNNYNGNLINILSTNKDAIEKGTYVVIPNSGIDTLKEYGLLLTEEEYKNMKKTEEEEKN